MSDAVTPAVAPAPVPAVKAPARAFAVHTTVRRLAGAHFVVDWFSNSLPPLLPLLVPRLGLTLAGAGALTMVLQLSSSVSQVLFGGSADRGHARRLAWWGLVGAALGLGSLGLCTSWWQLIAALVVGGLGVAAFHPAGALLAHRYALGRPGHSMAIYVTSGTMGFACGPIVIASIAQRWGLPAVAWLIVPGLVAGWLLLRLVPEPPAMRTVRRGLGGFAALRPHARPLALLYLVVVIRGFVSAMVTTFLPVLLARRGAPVTLAAAGVTAYFLGGGLGGFFGGSLADTVGYRRIILISMLGASPFLIAAPALEPAAALACLTLAGFFLQSTLSANVSFGQMIAPGNAAVVASLLMGLAWGLGGLLIPLAGGLADRFGLVETMVGLGFVPLLGVAVAWPLPRTVR
jgi:FSR family fosmidomycin resistance protein-like MFS transporter